MSKYKIGIIRFFMLIQKQAKNLQVIKKRCNFAKHCQRGAFLSDNVLTPWRFARVRRTHALPCLLRGMRKGMSLPHDSIKHEENTL